MGRDSWVSNCRNYRVPLQRRKDCQPPDRKVIRIPRLDPRLAIGQELWIVYNRLVIASSLSLCVYVCTTTLYGVQS